MPHLSIDQFKPGMVLATDVTGTNGRLLLSKGQSIAHKHLTIFKMWAVPEVQVHQQGVGTNQAWGISAAAALMQGRALDVTVGGNRTDDGELNPPRGKPRGMRALPRFKKQVYCFSEFVSQWKGA